MFDKDPLDTQNVSLKDDNISLNIELVGETSEDKISKISQNLSDNEAIYLTDCDEVSYLFNLRNFSQVYSAKIRGKAVILKDNAVLFTQDKLKMQKIFLKLCKKKFMLINLQLMVFDYKLIEDRVKELATNPVKNESS